MKVPKININNMPGAGLIKNLPARRIKYKYKPDPKILSELDRDVFMKKNLKAPVSGDGFVSKFRNNLRSLLQSRKKKDLREAVDSFRRYQYSSDLTNSILREAMNDKIFVPVADESDWFRQEYLQMLNFVKKGYNMLSKPLKEDVVVHRIVFNENVEDGYRAAWNIGEIVNEKGFTSTSLEPDNPIFRHLKNYYLKTAEDCENFSPVNIKIKLPKGTKVIADDTIMKEVLIKNNSLFKVVDFDEATNTYVWEFLKSKPVKFANK